MESPQDNMNEEEIERYARHIIMPEIGGAGQQKLKAARVLVIGVGGLGAPAIIYLAAAGVGTIGLVDADHVDLSNLQRQIIHHTASIGQSKTRSARVSINNLNPHVRVEEHNVRLENHNVAGLIASYDVIIDCSDNAATRYLVADQAHALEKPLISGAVGRFEGALTVLMPYRDNNPSYRDLFPVAPSENSIAPCRQAGIVGALPGVIGSLQAMEAIKLICQLGEPLIGRLLLYDGLRCHFDIIHYKNTR